MATAIHFVYIFAGSHLQILAEFDNYNAAYEFRANHPERSKLYMGVK